jgi:hypothetical protein
MQAKRLRKLAIAEALVEQGGTAERYNRTANGTSLTLA